MQAGVGEGPCPATRQMLDSYTKPKTHHSFRLRSCPWCGVALLPCAQGHTLSRPHRKDRWKGKGRGSTFVITTVQLAHCCPPCLQTEAMPPPATGANIFRYLHLHLPRSLEGGSLRQPLTGQLPFLCLAGAFRKKALKSHQSPCQAEPPGPPALPVPSLPVSPPNTRSGSLHSEDKLQTTVDRG